MRQQFYYGAGAGYNNLTSDDDDDDDGRFDLPTTSFSQESPVPQRQIPRASWKGFARIKSRKEVCFQTFFEV